MEVLRVKKYDENRIQVMYSGEPIYPALLKEIKDYPKALYYVGNLEALKKRGAAVVGSRRTTPYGRSIAYLIGKRLGEKNITVVSGMARGIDTCAHQGAITAGGFTIAVLGCGVDICYPASAATLKGEIERNGMVISEYEPGTEPQKYHFPRRNRIISGLSENVTVVQAGNRSGALITAEIAAEQGRDVYAVPGNIDSEYSFGTNKLIKEGASPLITVEEILEIMGVGTIDEDEAKRILGKAEHQIFCIVKAQGEITVDELCRELSKPAEYVSGIVTVMEMKGVLFSALGKIFIAKD